MFVDVIILNTMATTPPQLRVPQQELPPQQSDIIFVVPNRTTCFVNTHFYTARVPDFRNGGNLMRSVHVG
jgi:hypothetical protein